MISIERKQAFLDKLTRVTAYRLLRNLMAEAVEAFNSYDRAECERFFALDEPDLWVEYADEGRFTGREALRALLDAVMGKKRAVGEGATLFLTTPVIEVAGDGESAQGVWWCPIPMTALAEGGKTQAIWAFGSVAVDFLLLKGEWKIWHLHYFRVFKCKYEMGWVDDLSMINRLNLPAHPLSEPCTYHNPYSPLSIRDGIPAAPRPYLHYKDASWMTKTRKDV